MLVLSRKPGEQIRIGEDIVVTVLAVTGGRVRLGLTAPSGIRVVRSEIADPASSLEAEGFAPQPGSRGKGVEDRANHGTRPLAHEEVELVA